mmetsp:Transcript_28229/g.56575  ORF Transcript_28229/g.56575 Transcript_28229/m.56575 type:complete len:368 (+) Transcript_28229:265-1368(+)
MPPSVPVRYYVPGDGDSPHEMNVFLCSCSAPAPSRPTSPAIGPAGSFDGGDGAGPTPTLEDLRSSFPLPGQYFFRFKAGLSSSGKYGPVAVWLDEGPGMKGTKVPTYRGQVVCKVTRTGLGKTVQRRAPSRVSVTAPVHKPTPLNVFNESTHSTISPAALQTRRPSVPPTDANFFNNGHHPTNNGRASPGPVHVSASAEANLLDGIDERPAAPRVPAPPAVSEPSLLDMSGLSPAVSAQPPKGARVPDDPLLSFPAPPPAQKFAPAPMSHMRQTPVQNRPPQGQQPRNTFNGVMPQQQQQGQQQRRHPSPFTGGAGSAVNVPGSQKKKQPASAPTSGQFNPNGKFDQKKIQQKMSMDSDPFGGMTWS